ncbi:hypothetical protein P3S68_005935 [Capsicum galapagoense]
MQQVPPINGETIIKTLFALNDVTDQVLHEILIRLPTNKEATRCKLVCKRWFSLLSSDHFFLHAEGLSRLTVDLRFLYAYRSIDHTISLAASSGDLILLDGRNHPAWNYYYICNIITRQWFALPPAHSETRGGYGESVGFLYEPLDNDDRCSNYVVLRFSPYGYYREGNARFDVQIFSSHKGTWTRSLVTSPRLFNCPDFRLLLVDGCYIH